MTCYVAVRATDGSNNYLKGYITSVSDNPYTGSGYVLPNFIILTLSDCDASQVENFLDGWDIKFKHTVINENDLGYRIKIEVEPIYISASDVGKTEIKESMRDWTEDLGFTVQNFTNNSMTLDIAKPVNLLQVKIDFADVFDDVLSIRRYYFSHNNVDSVVSSGGKITLTKAQALNFIIDKLEE